MKPHAKQLISSLGALRPLALVDPHLGQAILHAFHAAGDCVGDVLERVPRLRTSVEKLSTVDASTYEAIRSKVETLEERQRTCEALVSILSSAVLRYRACRGTRERVVEAIVAVHQHCDGTLPSVGAERLESMHDPELTSELASLRDEAASMHARVGTLDEGHVRALSESIALAEEVLNEALAGLKNATVPRSKVIAAMVALRERYTAIFVGASHPGVA